MLNFVFCIHNHQPVGNFDYIIEDGYKKAYLPFLEALSEYPSIKFSLHTSGCLLDWLIKNHKEYIDLLRSMVERGQVELMGGGYYEPILAVIPNNDRIGQIRMMSDRLQELFGRSPRGIWLTERVWEPQLPSYLVEAGVEYVVVDDYHLFKAGLKGEDLTGYYITEDQGCVLKVFPGSERLRYLIPFKPVEDLLEYLKGISVNSPLIVFANDGEKFGIWPGTHKWVYKDGWLNSFLGSLNKNLDWIRPITFSEYMDNYEPIGRVYLPTTSYREMGEWALPAKASMEYTNLINDIKTWPDGERIRRFLQGGFWRNFLAKYPEANWMHKRMLLVSGQKKTHHSSLITHHLYKAQCNDAYWHGIFGGLYLPHLRMAVYENLIKAENLLETMGQGVGSRTLKPCIMEADLDADTKDEILLRTPYLNLFLSPHRGGSIFELDYRPKAINLLNTLSRYREGYHSRLRGQGANDHQSFAVRGQGTKSIHELTLSKEEGLEEVLVYDSYQRVSLLDRFFSPQVTLEDLRKGAFEEGDFVHGEYTLTPEHRTPNTELSTIYLSREGKAFGQPVKVVKEITPSLDEPIIRIHYTIENMGGVPIKGLFTSEWNILLGFGLKGMDHGVVGEFRIQEEWARVGLRMSFHPTAHLYTYPVETISLSEAGFEKNFQGLCVLPSWEIGLPGNESVGFSLRVEVFDL